MEDDAGTIPEEMVRDAAQNVRKRGMACITTPAVILGTLSSYVKNAVSQLSSRIFGFKIQSLLTKLYYYYYMYLRRQKL